MNDTTKKHIPGNIWPKGYTPLADHICRICWHNFRSAEARDQHVTDHHAAEERRSQMTTTPATVTMCSGCISAVKYPNESRKLYPECFDAVTNYQTRHGVTLFDMDICAGQPGEPCTLCNTTTYIFHWYAHAEPSGTTEVFS